MPPRRPLIRRPVRSTLARTVACTAALLWCAVAAATGHPYAGRPLEDVLQELEARGLRLIYSSETVSPSLRVVAEPAATADDDVLREVLAPHGLYPRRVGADTYAIVRGEEAATPAESASQDSGKSSSRLEEIVVAASRYSLSAEVPDPHTFLTQDEIEGLPRLAEDSLKAVQRLPGAASNGLAGLAYMRGGDSNETLVLLDGLPLYEPFHLRLLLSPVSLLDARMLSGIDVHAGGFTARYGDRMSAIVEATSLRPDADAYYELGLSLFHASALASHRFADGDGQWLVAGRRSNLDEVADLVDSDLGEPAYLDGFARVDYAFGEHTRGSLQALQATDHAEVQNTAETEFAKVRYRNSYVWATVEHEFSPALAARGIASYTDVHAQRSGEVDDPGNVTGAADDDRTYDVLGLNLDASWKSGRWLHEFGLDLRRLSAEYDYTSRARFEAGYPFPQSVAREAVRASDAEPSGNHVAAYVTSRVLLTERLAAEVGLRWDQQTYGVESDDQWGPRANLAWELGATTRLRASWGRYEQFQGINELQVEDGIDAFRPAQVADHSILSLEQGLPAGWSLRVEAYRKDYREPMARYESLYDPLSLVPELRWDRVRIAPDSARAEGVEWLLTRKSSGPWNGWLSYAWSRATDREDGRDTRRSWDQTHSFGGGLAWSSGPWQATAATAWRTGWPTTPAYVVNAESPDAAVVLGQRNASRYGNYGSLDLRLSRDFDLPHGDLTVFVEATNATDRANRCCTDLSYEYEAGHLTLDREYRDWLPIVPSIGVLWRY